MNAKEKEHKAKAVYLGIELSYNKTYVEYFGIAPEDTHLLMINSTKVVKSVFLESRISNMETNRTIYNVKNIAICSFLNNRLMSKLYSAIYDQFVGNSSIFKCPIQPGVYYLRNDVRELDVPMFHPPGKFSLTVRIKELKDGPVVLQIFWKYRVLRI
ncbi:uncharacterized protein LOC108106212 [Drosophila eugracilis]|uniref:uncharacterized protein LOC108106212 n=1 Tax=Drosophila eugracilis TaxID=29029 RepID=UPI001BDAC912|nr:uncharacterized protein LOC108106212 [Drosophila eugracilis]